MGSRNALNFNKSPVQEKSRLKKLFISNNFQSITLNFFYTSPSNFSFNKTFPSNFSFFQNHCFKYLREVAGISLKLFSFRKVSTAQK